MKERPILFSGAMVNAILEGRKTQTRRVVKPQPSQGTYRGDGVTPTFQWKDCINTLRPLWPNVMNEYCPYGQPGDQLWVRETWQCSTIGREQQRQDWVRYRVTDGEEMYWRPSIFMPRWASRITLEVTGVRVERVQDITPRDVVSEGLYHAPGEWGADKEYDHLIKAFAHLWDSINAKRGYGWENNPWVWVVEFTQT